MASHAPIAPGHTRVCLQVDEWHGSLSVPDTPFASVSFFVHEILLSQRRVAGRAAGLLFPETGESIDGRSAVAGSGATRMNVRFFPVRYTALRDEFLSVFLLIPAFP